jgi:hypothetical protein
MHMVLWMDWMCVLMSRWCWLIRTFWVWWSWRWEWWFHKRRPMRMQLVHNWSYRRNELHKVYLGIMRYFLRLLMRISMSNRSKMVHRDQDDGLHRWIRFRRKLLWRGRMLLTFYPWRPYWLIYRSRVGSTLEWVVHIQLHNNQVLSWFVLLRLSFLRWHLQLRYDWLLSRRVLKPSISSYRQELCWMS